MGRLVLDITLLPDTTTEFIMNLRLQKHSKVTQMLKISELVNSLDNTYTITQQLLINKVIGDDLCILWLERLTKNM